MNNATPNATTFVSSFELAIKVRKGYPAQKRDRGEHYSQLLASLDESFETGRCTAVESRVVEGMIEAAYGVAS